MQKWQTCRQAAAFHVSGIRPEGEKSKTFLGTIFHNLLEKHYLGEADAMGMVFQKLRDKAITKGSDLQQLENLLAQAQALFDVYRIHWKKDDAKKTWEQVEGVFDVQWNGWRLRGRCDGLYRDKNGKLWLLETKTKSRIMAGMDSALAFDPQNLLYLQAKEQEVGEPIIGVLYNVIRQPSLRQKAKESTGQFFARIVEDIKERPEHYFMRYELRYTKKTRKRFADELVEKLEDFKYWQMGDSPTYRSECNCTRGWSCEYLELCASNSMVGYREDGQMFVELLED